MPLTIQCFESATLPARVAVEANDGARVTVYLLDSDRADGRSVLRDTVLRIGDDAPPPGATFLLSFLVIESDRTRLPLLRVERASRVLPVDILRAENRARAAVGSEVRTGARFELTLLDRRTVGFSLHFSGEGARGGRALVGGGGTRGRAAASTTQAAFWLLPSLWQIWTDPLDEIQDAARGKLAALGLTPSMLIILMTLWVPLTAGGWYAWSQHSAAAEATAKADAAAATAAAAGAGRDAALAAEATCMEQRTELARQLDDDLAERAVLVESALASGASRAVAVELGDGRLRGPELERFEAASLEHVQDRLARELADTPDLPDDAQRCLGASAALEKDLPPWVLLWHPDPRVVCPIDFESEADGVRQVGSWGLSDRVLRQFNVTSAAEGDPRRVDRVASTIHASGLRAIRQAILAAPVGERPPVAPAEVHLWTLALWDAYNRMPSPSDGALDEPAAVCVSGLMGAIAQAERAPLPGLPVLHDLVDHAEGRLTVEAPRTAGCPWPADAVPHGANAALRAVARAAAAARSP